MGWKEDALAHHESARKIGQALHKKLKPKLRERWGADALGTRVAELMRGNARWWIGTGADAFPVLADMLGVPIEDLVGASAAATGELAFREFPGLPALGPDEPPFASRDHQLFGMALDFRGGEARLTSRRWIVAAPGSGKSLVVRYLATRAPSAFVAASVETLEHALPLVADRGTKLVVELERSAPSDQDAYRALTSATHACTVLAPFPIPDTAWRSDTKKSFTTLGWTALFPAPFSEWRDDFVRWIVNRVERAPGRETRLDLDALRGWLVRNDPDCTLVATPGDLLALASDFDQHGEREPLLSTRAERWLRDVGTAQLGDAIPATWRKRLATRAYVGLVDAQFSRLDVDLVRASTATWEGLVPRETSARTSSDDPGAPLTVAAWLDAGLLRGDKLGVSAFPRWVAQGLRERTLGATFDADDTSGWGRYAADEPRRDVVDRALDRLSSGAFRRVAKAAIAAFDLSSLSRRAALEAAFAAAGRRGQHAAPTEADVETWQELARLQLMHLEGSDAPGERLTPYTRRDPEELFASGWSVSLAVPAPPSCPRPGWLAPGWTPELRLEQLPPGFPPAVGEGGHKAAERVCTLAPVAIARIEVQPLGEHLPLVLLPALLLDVDRAWTFRPKDLSRLYDGLFEEAELARGATRLDAGARSRLSARLWSLLADPGAACVVERLEGLEKRPRLAHVILPTLPPEVIEATVRVDGLHVRSAGPNSHLERDPIALRTLDRALRARALRAWSTRPPVLFKKWMEAQPLLSVLDAEDVELIAELVNAADYETGMQLAKFVWETDPRGAQNEAASALDRDAEGAGRWFWSAPRPAIPVLAQLVVGNNARPGWTSAWAYRRALDAGTAADELYALSRA